MIFFNNKNKLNFLLITVPLLLLIYFFTMHLFGNKIHNTDLKSNPFLPNIDKKYISEIEKNIKNKKDFLYYTEFIENDFEREVILIKKNPTKSEIRVPIYVRVFPTDKKQYVHQENYNKKGFLEFSTNKRKPILHTSENDIYSVLKINIPFIDIEKILVFQAGIWKQTFTKPFKKLNKSSDKNKIDANSNLYLPVFNQLLKENKISYNNDKSKTVGIVTDKKQFWSYLSKNNLAFLKLIKFNGENKKIAMGLLADLSNRKISFSQVFDIDKLATYYAIINLFSNNESNQIGFIFNKQNNTLEPIYLNKNKIGSLNTYLKNEKIVDAVFLDAYTKKLSEISNINIEKLVKNTPKLSSLIKNVNDSNPSNLFSSNILLNNKLVIKKGIHPAITIKTEFLDINKSKMRVSIKNNSDFPIEIIGLNYKKKKKISTLNEQTIILGNKKDTITFDLPRSFENLFVHKKSKTTGFIFEKNIFDLMIPHKILGLNKIYYSDIIPYQAIESYNRKQDLFRKKIDISNFPFLKIENNIISFIKSFTLNKPLILPKNYIIKAKPGITINIINGGKIISYSPLQFIGTKEKPIKILSKDKDGQGLLILAEGKKSVLNYVYFDGLTNLFHGKWSTSSSITFYESPVDINYCKIANNSCEDALNIVRTKFNLTNTSFVNTQSDAFDGDFVQGNINSCVFNKIGNDAIDVSGSDLKISNVKIFNAGDKGISAGENSKISAKKVSLSNCGIAIAGKDLSLVTVKNINIKNTKLGFTAFQKKPEFGPSKINAKNIKMSQVETKYLIENTSTLLVDNDTIRTKQADVKSRMYGVDFGVSSKDTKNRKK